MVKVQEFVAEQRRKLIDTTMRNRLLNYIGGSRSAAVEIAGEQPAAIWQLLVNNEQKMEMRGLPYTVPDEVGTDSHLMSAVSISRPSAFDSELSEVFDVQHLDEFLETNLEQELLNTKLRRLSDTAKASLEEQGVATLFVALGFLHFYEADASDKDHKGPLLLVPVSLVRTKSDRWSIETTDDDPLINPALVEYLRRSHGLELPAIAEEGFQPSVWFAAVQQLIRPLPRWRVSAACLVGNFSFQKFVMHEDLKKNEAVISAHATVARLANRGGGSSVIASLPPGIRERNLDTDFAPEATWQVVDADSTQQRALAAVASGADLVIQGPPGTGKSQTITNLISGALASGKTVLFVAEKQAALNVVYDRLKKADLGDFCLELHSSKANKKAVLEEVRRALDESSKSHKSTVAKGQDLPTIRGELTAYAQDLHKPLHPLGLSPFFAMGLLLRSESAPNVKAPVKVSGVTNEEFRRAGVELAKLSQIVARIGEPWSHAWRDSAAQHLVLAETEKLDASLDALNGLFPAVQRATDQVLRDFGLGLDRLDVAPSSLTRLAELLEQSPGFPPEVLADPSWDSTSANALGLVEQGRRLSDSIALGRQSLADGVELAELADSVSVVLTRGRSIWAWLSGRWRSARRRLKASVVGAAWVGAFDVATKLSTAIGAESAFRDVSNDKRAASFFGARWKGEETDWAELQRGVSWGSRFRGLVAELVLSAQVFSASTFQKPGVLALRELAAQYRTLIDHWNSIADVIRWPQGYFQRESLSNVASRFKELESNREEWRTWTEFQSALTGARATIAAPMVELAMAGTTPWATLAESFNRRFLSLWLSDVEARTPSLRAFRGEEHLRKISSFRELDRQAMERNQFDLGQKLRAHAQAEIAKVPSETKFLRDQMARSRGHQPVRQLIKRSLRALRAIKPCFLMSPMTVAQTLDPTNEPFDLVIFDEASQLTVEDSIGTVARGKQLVVVGDPKQLPPTNFFAAQLGEIQVDTDENDEEKFDELESILEQAEASGFHGARLRWHYRSRHESLIAYSNKNFYDSSLLTFPSSDREVGVRGLSFEYVAEGRYEGKGTNSKEAERVVAAVVAHAREFPTRSLCVGTFSVAQQIRIQDLIERARRSDPILEDFLSADKSEPFFVKNLESIQGDERDVVFLSVTYGPGEDGKIKYNFGPLNGETGWRRLNVLTTRAREQMRVFSCMRAEDMAARSLTKGPTLLRDFLGFAETGKLESGPQVDSESETESPFEEEVKQVLRLAGIDAQSQIGVSDYRIDFGIADPDFPGRFVCGIECDGASYHSAESARDRDRLRAEVLRGLGWELHRVWSTDWWHDRKGQTDRLLRLIRESTARARAIRDHAPIGANAETKAPVVMSASGSLPPPVSPPRSPASGRVPRPLTFRPYRFATVPSPGWALVDAAPDRMRDVVIQIVQVEGPIHTQVLRERVISAFGHERAGPKINAHLDASLASLVRDAVFEVASEFWSIAGASIIPRNRAGAELRPEQIAPGEYAAAVQAALIENPILNDEELTGVLRDAFGYSSVSARLRESVAGALTTLRADGQVTLSSLGYGLVSEAPLRPSVAVPQPEIENPVVAQAAAKSTLLTAGKSKELVRNGILALLDPSTLKCTKCNSRRRIWIGRTGPFLQCENRACGGRDDVTPAVITASLRNIAATCVCGQPSRLVNFRGTSFIGCSNYPQHSRGIAWADL